MFLDEFHSVENGSVRVTAQQASRFAKEVASDYNPIHDPDAKRFCVPGDLLFALVLANYGLSERMSFEFRGMVGEGVSLKFPKEPGDAFDVTDEGGKVYLHVTRAGEATRDPAVIEAFTRRYVAFSGQNFPHFLQPLMAEHKVMFNPDRPLVIYDSMDFELQRLDALEQETELADAVLDVNGKRGDAQVHFRLLADDQVIGSGCKKLVISGLREYDDARMQEVVVEFNRRKQDYKDGLLAVATA
jgi:hypothetical protein